MYLFLNTCQQSLINLYQKCRRKVNFLTIRVHFTINSSDTFHQEATVLNTRRFLVFYLFQCDLSHKEDLTSDFLRAQIISAMLKNVRILVSHCHELQQIHSAFKKNSSNIIPQQKQDKHQAEKLESAL